MWGRASAAAAAADAASSCGKCGCGILRQQILRMNLLHRVGGWRGLQLQHPILYSVVPQCMLLACVADGGGRELWQWLVRHRLMPLLMQPPQKEPTPACSRSDPTAVAADAAATTQMPPFLLHSNWFWARGRRRGPAAAVAANAAATTADDLSNIHSDCTHVSLAVNITSASRLYLSL